MSKRRQVVRLVEIREGESPGYETHVYELVCGHLQNRQMRSDERIRNTISCGACRAEVIARWGYRFD